MEPGFSYSRRDPKADSYHYAVDPAAAHRMSPRIIDGGAELCETLARARGK
jgi:hypothetical protein